MVTKKDEMIAIFDLDGTLVKEGHDSWFAANLHFIDDRQYFVKICDQLHEVERGDYDKHFEVFQDCLFLFRKEMDGDMVFAFLLNFFLERIQKREIHFSVVQRINQLNEDGYRVIISTASFVEAAMALKTALIQTDILSEVHGEILTQGSLVDWPKHKLMLFNMAEKKAESIANYYGCKIEDLKGRIIEGYGDDPFFNDRPFLDLSEKAYVIPNSKNKDFKATGHYEIFKLSDSSPT